MDEEGVSMEEFKLAFEKGNMFASGIGMTPATPRFGCNSSTDICVNSGGLWRKCDSC